MITLNSFDCIVRIILVLECVLLSFQSNCLLALTKKLSLEDALQREVAMADSDYFEDLFTETYKQTKIRERFGFPTIVSTTK